MLLKLKKKKKALKISGVTARQVNDPTGADFHWRPPFIQGIVFRCAVCAVIELVRTDCYRRLHVDCSRFVSLLPSFNIVCILFSFYFWLNNDYKCLSFCGRTPTSSAPVPFLFRRAFFLFFIVDLREMGRKRCSQRVLIESTVKKKNKKKRKKSKKQKVERGEWKIAGNLIHYLP